MSRRSNALVALLLLTLAPASEAARPLPPKPPTAPPQPAPIPKGTAFRFDTSVPEQAAGSSGAPMSLTASDGTGLKLVALDARGVVEGPLAFTELHLTFENPQDRIIEGQFQITLPPGADISRFAMKINESWQEGEVVERQRARQIYEDFLHRRQDPALLEQQAGNLFSARVFPIPARGRKEIIVSYSHELENADEAYRIGLLGLPEVGQLDLAVQVAREDAGTSASNLGGTTSRHELVEVHQTAWTPDRDFLLPAEGRKPGLRNGDLVVARVSPDFKEAVDPIDGLVVLVDTSASRALSLEHDLRFVDALLDGLAAGRGASTPVSVVGFDQVVTPIYEGAASGFGEAQIKKATDLLPMGASNPVAALDWVKSHTKAGRYNRLLVVTDGVATAGDTETGDLRTAAEALGGVGIQRVDALVSGGLREERALAGLVTAGLARDGVVIDADLGVRAAGSRLERATVSGVPVEVAGAAWSWPRVLDGVQAGDSVLVYAQLKDPAADLSLKVGELRWTMSPKDLAPAERPLLERAAVSARIDRLLTLRDTEFSGDPDLRGAMQREATELSLKYRVLTPWTALLVLETQADYARYGLDRKGLADILTVGPRGVDVLARSSSAVATTPVSTPIPPNDRAAAEARARAQAQAKAKAEAQARAEASQRAAAMDTSDAVEDEKKDAAPIVDAQTSTGSTLSREFLSDVPSGRSYQSAVSQSAGVVGSGTSDGGVQGGVIGGDAAGAVAAEPAAPPPPPMAGRRETLLSMEEAEAPAEEAVTEGRRAVADNDEDDETARSSASRSSVGTRTTSSAPRTSAPTAPWATPSRPEPRPAPRPQAEPARDEQPKENPWTGPYAEVHQKLSKGQTEAALQQALAWRAESPGDVLALLALGETFEVKGDARQAARACGSIIDLFPSRADMRRMAGNCLDRLPDSLALAADTYQKAVEQRADHPSGHRMLAYALLRSGDPAAAFAAIEVGLRQSYPSGRFAGYDQVLREDAGLIAAAWLARDPSQRDAVLQRLSAIGGRLPEGPTLRFVLSWETDANDVDFHIHDGKGGHAYYSQPVLQSGGRLYADVTTGYGPECFTVPNPKAYPYTLEAHYYRKGPMGYGMGKLEIIESDGKGGLRFDERPFVVMQDNAFVNLGTVRAGK